MMSVDQVQSEVASRSREDRCWTQSGHLQIPAPPPPKFRSKFGEHLWAYSDRFSLSAEPFRRLADITEVCVFGVSMTELSGRRLIFAVLAIVSLFSAIGQARAQEDFFASFFGLRPIERLNTENRHTSFIHHRRISSPRTEFANGSRAFCVRTCDGRYFPLAASDSQSREGLCNSFCPASETKVFYGDNIEKSSTREGESYSKLPNALRYRNEIVTGCTCNGKDQIGLAPIKIEDDVTIKKGDIVASDDGLMVTGRSADKHGTALDLTTAAAAMRARYERMPLVASRQ
jgi:hypothetical protein